MLSRVVVIGLVVGSLLGCEEPAPLSTLTKEAVFAPQVLDFGTLPLGTFKSLPISLENTGRARFDIDRVDVPEGFRLWGLKRMLEGSILNPGATEIFEIIFEPTEEGPVEAKLIVYSGDLAAELTLKGAGEAERQPMLAVAPNALDFDVIAVGMSRTLSFEVLNTGNAPGEITTLTWGSTGDAAPPAFSVAVTLPLTVEPGARVPVEVTFAPTDAAQRSDTLTLEAADHPELTVTLNGQGLQPIGDIVCNPTQLDFGPVERGQTAAQTINCEAVGGAARILSADISGSAMFGLTAPVVDVDLPTGESTEVSVQFEPEGLPSSQEGTLRIRYEGAMGLASVTVTLAGEVVPPPATETAISLVLSWPTSDTDVDLHLVAPGGSFFHRELDCYFDNMNPDWGQSGMTEDNPFLDRDDIDGFGPENLNLTQAAPGTYEVYVHYFSDHWRGSTDATIEVHLAGQLVHTRRMRSLRCDEMWHVGTIEWNGTDGTFTARDTRRDAGEGSCIF